MRLTIYTLIRSTRNFNIFTDTFSCESQCDEVKTCRTENFFSNFSSLNFRIKTMSSDNETALIAKVKALEDDRVKFLEIVRSKISKLEKELEVSTSCRVMRHIYATHYFYPTIPLCMT